MEVFKEWIEGMFSKTNQKVIYICGHFNINLLNPSKHKMTDEFINTMYSCNVKLLDPVELHFIVSL